MGRIRSVHVCSSCGAQALRWSGRCPTCGEWNSLVEESSSSSGPQLVASGASRDGARRTRLAGTGLISTEGAGAPVRLVDVDPDSALPFATGIGELDRVLAGGLVPGSVTLIGGEPGIGKSTLVLQAVASLAAKSFDTLVIAAEESAEQVRRRATRLGDLPPSCYIAATTDLTAVLEAVAKVRPQVVVVDSIQTVSDPLVASHPGSTSQVRECAGALSEMAKATGSAVILVGHVTKEGSLAGPRTLEHLVDTVLTFDGDRHHALRMLVATKHRFGPTGEVGVFEMTEEGLTGLDDPAGLLLAGRGAPTPGTVIVPVAEGRRPLLVEMQALVTEAHGTPRRVVEGISSSRAALMLAVIERSLGIPTGTVDLFASTVGGIRVSEPAADLALALCVFSAITGRIIPSDVVVFGEVGLTGEVRHTPRAERRLSEAERLGFRHALVPEGACGTSGVDVRPVKTLQEAATILNQLGSLSELSLGPPTGGMPLESEQAAGRLRSSFSRG